MKELLPVHIRWMLSGDQRRVLEIERASFDAPWSVDDFLCCFTRFNVIGIVAQNCDRVLSFMLYEILEDAINVVNLAVDPGYRRHGIASQLLGAIACKLTRHRRNRIMTVIRERNLPAQQFFAARGFKATQVLRDADGEDGYLMEFQTVQPRVEDAAERMLAELGGEAGGA